MIRSIGFFSAIALWLLLAGSVAAKDAVDQACDNAIACARNSVVSVLPLWPDGARRSEEPEGSGIAVGDGRLIATADHVVGPATKVLVRTHSGEVITSRIVLRDPVTDIALLRIDLQLPPFEIASGTKVASRTCAIGNSFGLDISLTCGVVSAIRMSGVGFNQIEDFIQTDAAVNPGMSGGALVDETGALTGMLSAIFTKKSDANIGVNFAVSSELLNRVISDYLEKGRTDRIQPGILVRPSLKPGSMGISGLQVVRVSENTAEARSQLQTGDVVVMVGDRRTNRAGSYRAALALMARGTTAVLHIRRNGEAKTVSVRYD